MASRPMFESLQIAALNNVINGDNQEYIIRHIHRWYSKTYFTPLHIVEELPLVDILTAYYEDRYEGLKPPEVSAEIRELLETPEQRALRLKEEDGQAVIEADIGKQALIDNPFKDFNPSSKSDIGSLLDASKGLGDLTEQLNQLGKALPNERSQLTQLLPDIQMKFLSKDEEIDLDSDSFGLLDPKPQK